MKKHVHKTILGIVAAMLPFMAHAQEVKATSSSYFSNALFNTLFVAIILLLAIIAVLASVLKNIARSGYFLKLAKKPKTDETSAPDKAIGIIILLMGMAVSMSAQNANPAAAIAKDDWLIGGMDMFSFYSMIGIILVELSVIAVLVSIIQRILKSDKNIEQIEASSKLTVKGKTILDKLNASVEVEHEEEVMLDHDYDGIKELDNNLPPWWKYGFYLTIVVAVVYLVHYHIAQTGDLQTAEYNKEMAKAQHDIEEYMKTAANNVDETSVKQLEGADLNAGKQTFISTCAACHGKLGEGGVGPNLADNYWLHGGSLQDIFKTIKYGWPDKGMKSWKEDLSPIQIAQVASYIRTLKGTNPPNGKAPQGDLFQDAGAPVTDSTGVKTDSTKVQIAADSASIVKEKK
jgi:cytochrome c oxidase cbb3-type subunit 3